MPPQLNSNADSLPKLAWTGQHIDHHSDSRRTCVHGLDLAGGKDAVSSTVAKNRYGDETADMLLRARQIQDTSACRRVI
jgi:hypothetical protein